MNPVEEIRLRRLFGRVIARLTGLTNTSAHLYEIRYLNGTYTFLWDDGRVDMPVHWRARIYRSKEFTLPGVSFMATACAGVVIPREPQQRVKANPRLKLRWS